MSVYSPRSLHDGLVVGCNGIAADLLLIDVFLRAQQIEPGPRRSPLMVRLISLFLEFELPDGHV